MTADFTDRCSVSPDGHWRGCCRKHDLAYERQNIPRWKADADLCACIARLGLGDISSSMIHFFRAFACLGVGVRTIFYAPCVYLFVRIFGWIYWNRAARICGPLRARKERIARAKSPTADIGP